MVSVTVAEGEAVDQRQAVKPVVVLGAAHREEAGPVPQQSALQPGRDGACRSEVTRRFFLFKLMLFMVHECCV